MPDKLTTNTKGNGSGHNGYEYPSPTCPIITYKQTISIKARKHLLLRNTLPFLLNKILCLREATDATCSETDSGWRPVLPQLYYFQKELDTL